MPRVDVREIGGQLSVQDCIGDSKREWVPTHERDTFLQPGLCKVCRKGNPAQEPRIPGPCIGLHFPHLPSGIERIEQLAVQVYITAGIRVGGFLVCTAVMMGTAAPVRAYGPRDALLGPLV